MDPYDTRLRAAERALDDAPEQPMPDAESDDSDPSETPMGEVPVFDEGPSHGLVADGCTADVEESGP
jgi:hypothetical protein